MMPGDQSLRVATVGDIEELYHLEGVIGEGGCARVFEARCNRTQRKVAIKVVERAGTNPRRAAMVRAELEVSHRVRHPNIMTLLDHTASTDTVHMVMDKMDTDLFNFIKAKGPLCEKDAATVMRGVLSAVKELHAHNIVHLDIKPENVLLNTPHCVKLCDFGLSTFVDEETCSTRPQGTVLYASPELLQALLDHGAVATSFPRDVLKKMDLWSCGIVLYCVLFARLPWKPSSCNRAGFRATLAEYKVGLPRWSSQWGSLSESAKDLLTQLTAFDASDRLSAEKALQHPFLAEATTHDTVHSDVADCSQDGEVGMTTMTITVDDTQHRNPEEEPMR